MEKIFVKGSLLSLSTAIILGMSGCSSSDSSDKSTSLVNGGAVDGYLQDATVFVDENNNTLHDVSEQNTTTDDGGDFTLKGSIANGTKIYAYGGVDKSTGKPFEGRLSAVYQGVAPILSPLSTYIAALVAKGESLSDAKTKVAAKLGISVDDVEKDPMTLPNVFLASQKIQKTVEVVAAATGESDFNTAYEDVFASLASASTDSSDFSASALVAQVVNDKNITIDGSVTTFLETYIAKIDELREQNATTTALDGIAKVLDTYTEVVESALENNDTTAISEFTNAIADLNTSEVAQGEYTDPIADALDAIQSVFDNNISYLGANSANNNITLDLQLTDPVTLSGVTLTWLSNSSAVDAATGSVTRSDINDIDVALTAKISKVAADANSTVVTKNQTYNLVVKRNEYAPIASAAAATIDEDTSAVVALSFSDQNQDQLSVSITTQASHGNATYANGNITYTPVANFNGTDSLVYTVTDSTGRSANATVSITVKPVNDLPIVVNDTAAVLTEGSVIIDVLANDSDPDGTPLTLASVATPLSGNAEILTDGTIKYTAGSIAGTDTFAYTVSDEGGADVNGTVTVTITTTPVVIDPTPDVTAFADGMEFYNFDVEENNGYTSIEKRYNKLNGGSFIENSFELNTTTGEWYGVSDDSDDYILGSNGWTTSSFQTYTLSNGVITFENGMAVKIDTVYDLTDPTQAGVSDLLANINTSVPGDTDVSFTSGAEAYLLAFKATEDMYQLWYTPHLQLQDTSGDWYDTDQTFSVLVDYMNSVNSPSGSYNDTTGDWIGVDFKRDTSSCDQFYNCPVIDSTGAVISSVTAGMSGKLVYTDHTALPAIPQTEIGTWEAKSVTNGGIVIVFQATSGNESYFDGDENLIGVADGVVRIGQYMAATSEFSSDDEEIAFNSIATGDIEGAISAFIDGGGEINPTLTTLTAVDDTISTQPNEAISYFVLANDHGGEGTYSIVSYTQGANGVVSDNGDGSLTYMPNTDYEGSDSFTYTMSDGMNEASATVNVNIATNLLPEAANGAFTMIVGETISGNVNAIDPEGEELTYTLVSITPSGILGGATSLASDGNFTLEAVAEGNTTVTLNISDGAMDVTITYDIYVEAQSTTSLYEMSETENMLSETEFNTYTTTPGTFPADTPLYSFWGVDTDENGTSTLEYEFIEFKTDGTFVSPDSNGTHNSAWNGTMQVSFDAQLAAKAVVINSDMSAAEIATEIPALAELGITLPTGSVVSKVAVLMVNEEYDIWESVQNWIDGQQVDVTTLAQMFATDATEAVAYNRYNYKRVLVFGQGEQASDGNGTLMEVDMTGVYMGLATEPTITNQYAGTWEMTTYTDDNGTTVDMIKATVNDELVVSYNKYPILVAPGIDLDGTTTTSVSRGSYTPANTGFVEYYFNDTAATEVINSFNTAN